MGAIAGPAAADEEKPTSLTIEVLEWDSAFFEVPIGRVNLDGATPASLVALDEQARDLGLACLYGYLDPTDGPTSVLVQAHGHRLVEVAAMLERPAVPYDPPPTASTVRQGTLADIAGLADAIALLAPWSRFGADPRFGPEQARRMHTAWMERAAEDGERHVLLVAEDASGLTGFSTLSTHEDPPRIDTIGTTRPGSGAPQALVAAAVERFSGQRILGGPIAARNVASQRFTQRCGFSFYDATYVYHRWLDEPATA